MGINKLGGKMKIFYFFSLVVGFICAVIIHIMDKTPFLKCIFEMFAISNVAFILAILLFMLLLGIGEG